LLSAWYSGWYNAWQNDITWISKRQEAEHELIVYCKANLNFELSRQSTSCSRHEAKARHQSAVKKYSGGGLYYGQPEEQCHENHDNAFIKLPLGTSVSSRNGSDDQRYTGFSQRHDHNPGGSIPAPPPKFGGVIKENAKDSKTWWPPTVVPPKGAPTFY